MATAGIKGINIPLGLPNNVKDWDEGHVTTYLSANKDVYRLEDEHIEAIKNQRVTGQSFLCFTDDHFRDCGIPVGPAIKFLALINELKKAKGLFKPDRHLRGYGIPVEYAMRIVKLMDELRKGQDICGPALLSESTCLRLCPPPLDYINTPKRARTTDSAHTCTPQSVVAWDSFKGDVNRVIWDDTAKYPRPAFRRYSSICDEESVRGALNFNVLQVLNTLLEGNEVFCRHASLEDVVGEPDFIQRDLNRTLRFIIEVKTKWVLSADDLVTAYTAHVHDRQNEATSAIPVRHQLSQVFGYLAHNHLEFGVLTTYDKTWFLHRPAENPGQLCVSPAIHYDDQQPTLFQCLFHLTVLARDKPNCVSVPPSLLLSSLHDDNDPSPDDGLKRKVGSRNSGGKAPKKSRQRRIRVEDGRSKTMSCPNHPLNGEEHVPLEFFDWGSFRVLDVLGNGRSGTVFKAILHGEMVALKICGLWQHPDYEEELLNEVKVYHALNDLQGDCIPKFKGAGYTAGGLFAIATDIVGRSPEDGEILSDRECRVIRRALSSVHRHGFVHNDVRKENILIKRNGRQFYAYLIDFAFSKQGCRHDFQKEMRLLKGLLGQS